MAERYGIVALPLIGDIGDVAAVSQMFSRTNECMGQIDWLVNNAGISQIGLLSELPIHDWQTMLDTNLSSCLLYTSPSPRDP